MSNLNLGVGILVVGILAFGIMVGGILAVGIMGAMAPGYIRQLLSPLADMFL